MLKYLALLFNTIALLICQFFFVGEVTITQNAPATVPPNSEFTVELTINKGSMGGFAKLQQFIPQGLTVEPIEMKGGDFKFVDQKVKVIWMSLPSDNEFKISYKVKVAAGIGGEKKIGGSFSYVVDNVKQEVEIPESVISVKSGAEEAAPIAETKPSEPEPKEEAVKATPVVEEEKPVEEVKPAAVAETTTTPTRTSEPAAQTSSGGVVCVRNAPKQIAYSKTNASNDFIVEIKIDKGNTSGFAKLVETLPEGFTATAMESAGGTFSFAEQKVKFVWVSIPAKPDFVISYKVNVPPGISGAMNIDGVFSYIENDETKKSIIATSTVIIENGEASAVVSNTNNSTETKTPENTNTTESVKEPVKEPVVEEVVKTPVEEPVKTPVEEPVKTPTEEAVVKVPASQTNVNYRVQIAALRNAKSATSVASIYNISESVITEMADGYTKYTVGSHNEYKSARDARENIRAKGVVGPFVTAYSSGKRITVQEALMITNQKWYK